MDRRYSRSDFPALVEAGRYTAVLRSMDPGDTAALVFRSGRAVDSFRSTAYRENKIGDSGVCYTLRINWSQRAVVVTAINREEYERAKRDRIYP